MFLGERAGGGLPRRPRRAGLRGGLLARFPRAEDFPPLAADRWNCRASSKGPPPCRSSRRSAREMGRSCLVEAMDRAPFVSLPGSFEEYVERLGTKERHELRRKMRRAGDRLPGLSFRVTRPGGGAGARLPSFVDLHRKSHPEKERFMDEPMAVFFREVAEGFLAAGGLRLAFLSARGDGRRLRVPVPHRRRAAPLQLRVRSLARVRPSPGLVLIARCIEQALGEGCAGIRFSARDGTLQVRPRRGGPGGLPRDGVRLTRHLLVSYHTCPMEEPGEGLAGGMNVFLRGLLEGLSRAGIPTDVITRARGKPWRSPRRSRGSAYSTSLRLEEPPDPGERAASLDSSSRSPGS